MPYTSHGHPIPMSPYEPQPRDLKTARCGGTSICRVCLDECSKWLTDRVKELQEKEAQDLHLTTEHKTRTTHQDEALDLVRDWAVNDLVLVHARELTSAFQFHASGRSLLRGHVQSRQGRGLRRHVQEDLMYVDYNPAIVSDAVLVEVHPDGTLSMLRLPEDQVARLAEQFPEFHVFKAQLTTEIKEN